MMKKITLTLTMICFVVAVAFALSTSVAFAQTDAANLIWGGQQNAIQNTIGLGSKDPRIIAASVINVILGFIGIIAVVIVLLGGFKWMTAGGNEDQIGEAKGLLSAGIIGLVIVLASWGLAKFVVDLLYNATQ